MHFAKQSKSKKNVAILLVVAMLLTIMPVAVFAEDGDNGGVTDSITNEGLGEVTSGSTPSAIQFVMNGNKIESLDLEVGETATVSAQVVDEAGVVVESAVPEIIADEANVISYENGIVTAVTVGNVTLTANCEKLESTVLNIAVTEKAPMTTSTVYVSETGSDETGNGVTLETAVQTIGKAIEIAKDNDDITILVSGQVSWGNAANWSGQSVTVQGLSKNDVIDVPKEFTLQGNLKFDTVGLTYGTRNTYVNGYFYETTESVYIAEEAENNYSQTIYGEGGNVILRGGKYAAIYGGGNLENNIQSDTISITVGGTAKVLKVYGGGKADVLADTIKIILEPSAYVGVIFGGGEDAATTTTNIFITVEEGATVEKGVYGGGYNGADKANREAPTIGNVDMCINGTVKEGGRLVLIESGVVGGGCYATLTGDVKITIGETATVHGICGGSQFRDLEGNVTIQVDGAVDYWIDNAVGSSGDDLIGGVIMGGCIYGDVTGDVTITLNGHAYTVAGGSDNGAVKGKTNIIINGTVKTLGENNKNGDRLTRYTGDVYGGGYTNSTSYMNETTVEGGTNIYIAPSAIIEDSVYGGASFAHTTDTYVLVEGTVRGNVYGGSAVPDGERVYKGQEVLGFVDGDATVILRGNASAKNVYAGGLLGSIWGNATVTLAGNATVENVYGCGRLENQRWYNGSYQEIEPIINFVKSNSKIQINDDAKVKDTIYGYLTLANEEEIYDRAVTGKATVVFDGNTGNFRRIVNADLVQVTANADTIIDNSKIDNEQLVNVADLVIDNGGKLHLLANAHILGNYAGDADKTGILVMNAGKTLTADGNVIDLTNISIVDADSVVPKAEQIYIISGAGSTTESGDFIWIDQRNGVKMAWKANEDSTTQWWLVSTYGYDLTLNYYFKATDGTIIQEGQEILSNHDVEKGTIVTPNPETYLQHNGHTYKFDASNQDNVVTVILEKSIPENNNKPYQLVLSYVREETTGGPGPDPWTPTEPPTKPDLEKPPVEIPDPDVPLVEPEDPTTEIDEPDVPLVEPGTPVEEIGEPEVPLGDAPKTGDAAPIVGLVGLLIAAVAGLVVTRRKFN